MAFTQSDIDALKAAIATGATKVRYPDSREIEYRSLRDMRETLRIMEADVSPPASSSSRSFVAGF